MRTPMCIHDMTEIGVVTLFFALEMMVNQKFASAPIVKIFVNFCNETRVFIDSCDWDDWSSDLLPVLVGVDGVINLGILFSVVVDYN
jgi:hypothetical protein